MWGLALASGVQAAEVGRFTQVEGQVELLKAGQAPAAPAAAQTGVEEKDVIKTGAESRAQLRFLDDTTITLAPESQITIESYLYDGPKGKRQAMLNVAQGLLQAVVAKVFKEKEPDFSIKTQTAIMGVRGTEFYVLVMENSESPGAGDSGPDYSKVAQGVAPETPQASFSTDVFVKSGRVSMNSSNPNLKETVLLGPQQSTRVWLNRPPGPRLTLAPKDFQRLRSSLVTGVARARIGPTRNPRELLQRLPLTPPRPGPPLRPGGPRSRLEGKPPTPTARPPGAPMTSPKAREKPMPPAARPLKPGEKAPASAARPLKPGEKPPAPAARPPAKGDPRRLTGPEAPRKDPRAAPAKPGERPRAAPTAPRKKEPAREPAARPTTKPPKATPPKKPPTPGTTPSSPSGQER